MICPKCYGSIDKNTQRCKSCGFNMKSIEGATHGAVKQAKKDGFGEDVVYTSTLPSDIRFKKLVLLCVFLGLVGGHSYYTGKLAKGLYSTIVFSAMLMFALLKVLNILDLTVPALQWAFSIVMLLMGINLALFFIDLVKICTKKYKVSVYKDSFSN